METLHAVDRAKTVDLVQAVSLHLAPEALVTPCASRGMRKGSLTVVK